MVVLALHATLVVLSVGGLRLAGLGIDFIRHELDPTSVTPAWPLGITPPPSWSPMQTVVAISAAALLIAVVVLCLRLTAAVTATALGQRILLRLRTDVYDKLQRLSFTFFDTAETSSLINRAAGDVQAVRLFVDGVVIRVLTVSLSLTVFLVYMLNVHVGLTFACLATSPLLWWGAAKFSRTVHPEYRRSAQLGDRMITTLTEGIHGVHVVKGFAKEDEAIERFEQATKNSSDHNRRIFLHISTFQPLMGLLTQMNMLVLIGYGGYLVIQGEIPLGAGLFVFANLLQQFAAQIDQIVNISNTIQTSLIGAERVFEVLDAPVEIDDREEAIRLRHNPHARDLGPSRARSITFENVSFVYGKSASLTAQDPGVDCSDSDTIEHKLVLADVAFTVRPGESLGIVGATGAGKSTLLSLIPRFYDSARGTVRVDGHDVRDIALDDLRRNVGVVFQESFLFSNTVGANIAFGHPDATLDQIMAAAELASAGEFIDELPEGYDTIVGEYGSNLSGGQRQRLAIARALLLDPPILLLDDATASVDAHTEHEIQNAIESAMQNRTTIFVSNRVSALRRADHLLVLQAGRVIQSGTHEDLILEEGYYRHLAELQFADLGDADGHTTGQGGEEAEEWRQW